ncbi:hypothetical protein AB5I41_31455 [Sphingomonas sp. MMS24-JH45]
MLDQRKWPLSWLDDEIASERATAFASRNACIVTALRQYPGGAVEIHGLGATGDSSEIVSLVSQAEEWGRCTRRDAGDDRQPPRLGEALDGYVETQVMIEEDRLMGLSGSKQTSTSKPVYGSQIEGAANNVNAADRCAVSARLRASPTSFRRSFRAWSSSTRLAVMPRPEPQRATTPMS